MSRLDSNNIRHFSRLSEYLEYQEKQLHHRVVLASEYENVSSAGHASAGAASEFIDPHERRLRELQAGLKDRYEREAKYRTLQQEAN